MANEFGSGPLGTILSGIANVFGIFRGANLADVKIGLFDLRAALFDVSKGLIDFLQETRSWLASLIGIFRRFYASGLLPLLSWLRAKFLALQAWLKRIFKPLIEFLLAVRKELLNFFTKYVRPVLDVISAIRFGLQLLGRLGVEWAQELDRKLARLENAIVENYFRLLRGLNQVIDVINAVVTFDLLLQRVPFLRTLVRDVSFLNRLWWQVNLSEVKPSAGPPEIPDELLPRPPEKDVAELRQFLLNGAGPKAGIIRELRSIILATARGANP